MSPDETPPDPATAAAVAHCDECGAPVEEVQRYCVNCGAHRRHVDDPAARYLSQTTARTRTRRAAAGRRTPAGARSRGLGIAVGLALIPAAAAVGVLAGRSSNDQDGRLIAELARQQATADRSGGAAATTAAATSAGAAGSASGSGAGSTTHHRGAHAHGAHAHSRHHSRSGGTKATTSTTPAPISTKPATAAQKKTGAKVTQKVQKSTGKSYVGGQSKLPGTVVVP